jgi:PKD repeat protein
MLISTSKVKRFLFFLLFLLPISGVHAQHFTGLPITVVDAKVDERLTEYEAYQLDADAIHQFLQTNYTGQPIHLSLGNRVWDLQLEINPIVSSAYQLRFQNEKGTIIAQAASAAPYRGYTLANNGKVRMTFAEQFMAGYMGGADDVYHIEPYWYTEPSAAKNIYLVYKKSAVIRDNVTGTCGNDDYAEMLREHVDEKLEDAHQHAETMLACYQVDLAIASDASMLTKYGSVSAVEAHNIAVINDVEGDYSGSFNHEIQFNIVTQFVSAANPWGASSNASTYLGNFRTWGNNGGFGVPFDLGELWTNIDLDGSTIGIAYLGAVCTSFKYHVLQDFSSNSELLRVLTSHEIGHNFNCQHDNCPTGAPVYIMCPFVSTSTDWSSASVSSVNAYVNNLINSGCVSACTSGPPPVPGFSWSPNPACVNQPVQFTNTSTGTVNTILWTFPGGIPATSTSANPTVTWATPGVKNVTLTLNSGTGSQAILSQQVTVIGNPTADFNFTVNGLTVNFNATATNATSYDWNFGDGSFSTDEDPVHTYATGDIYTVVLTVTGPCGTATRTLNVNTAPTAAFSASPTSGCTPLTVNFTNESSPNAVSYQWSFPGGTPTASTAVNPTVAYQNPGVFPVTLTAVNPNGSSSVTLQSFISVQTVPSLGFTSVVNGLTVTFTNTSTGASSYFWDFGDGNNSSDANPVHTYAIGGVYEVELTATNICGSSLTTNNVTMVLPPVAAFTANPSSGCGPLTVEFTNASTGAASYSWSFPGGTPSTSNATNVTVTYAAPGNYTAVLTATNAGGSNSSSQAIDVLTVPSAAFTSAVNGATVQFNNTTSGATTYNWSFGDGTVSNQEDPTHTYTADGVYQVVLTATNECGTATFTQTVTIATPPTAGFNASVVSGCAPLTVQFNNASSANANSFAWQFPGGNPSSSTQANPTVVYAAAGQYTVVLTVSNAAGSNTVTETNFITVNTVPAPGFSSSVNGYSVNFTNSSTGAVSYQWNFGDGGTSVDPNPTHLYTNAGTYTVVLTATNACGTATSTQVVTVVAPPTAAFSASPVVGCDSLLVQFNNTSSGNPTSFAWQFPGGNPSSSTLENPTVFYGAPGVYSVVLTVSNSAGSGTVTQTNYVVVGTAPTAGFNSLVSSNIVSFTNVSTGATSFSWSFGDGSSSTSASPTHTYATDGVYTVVLTASNNCGSSTFTQTVTIVTPPSANFTVAQANGCVPFTVQFNNTSSINATGFSWQFPGGTPATSTETNPVVVYEQAGVYSVTLVATNAAGNSSVTQTDLIHVGTVPSAGFSATTLGAVLTLDNQTTGATGYTWDFGDGNGSSLEEPSHTYTQDGIYTVSLYAKNACGTDTFTQMVLVITPPTAQFSAAVTEGCAPMSVEFTNTSTANSVAYNWEFPGGTPATSTEQHPTVEYTTPGTYTVILTALNAAGATTETKVDYIVVGTAPTASFSYQLGGLSAQFDNASVGASSYSWSFGDGGSSTDQNPVHDYAAPGEYLVVLTTTNACGTTEYTQTVSITGNPPIAAFSAGDDPSGCAPMSVQFTDLSVGQPTAWLWSFQGGTPSTSTEQNPVVVYSTPGVFSVELTASNLYGSYTTSQSNVIVVNTVPAVSFTIAGITNGQVAFSNGSSNAASYLWNFGDGIISTEENPVHTYTTSGTYTVSLTALNDCGVAVFSNEVTVMVVGVQEADWVEQYRLYPNPNSGVFTLELIGSQRDNLSFEFFNSLGQLIRNDILTFTTGSMVQTFDFGTLPAGMYSFRVSDGTSSMVFKVTIK